MSNFIPLRYSADEGSSQLLICVHHLWDELLFPADNAGEQGGAVSGRGGVEGVLKNACGMGAAADDHAFAGLNVGEQDVDGRAGRVGGA